MSQISLNEAEKKLKNDAKVYLYFAKKFEEDFDENFCFMMKNFKENLIKKERNFFANSSFTRNSKENFNSSEIEKIELDCLLQEYKDIFHEKLSEELPSKRVIDHVIDINDHNPVNKNAYQLSVQKLQEQTRQIEELLTKRLI